MANLPVNDVRAQKRVYVLWNKLALFRPVLRPIGVVADQLFSRRFDFILVVRTEWIELIEQS